MESATPAKANRLLTNARDGFGEDEFDKATEFYHAFAGPENNRPTRAITPGRGIQSFLFVRRRQATRVANLSWWSLRKI